MPGQFLWFDLLTDDPKAAGGFYTDLLGWSIDPDDGASNYTSWISDETGRWAAIADEATRRPTWVPYVAVENITDARDRAESLGATIVQEPTDGPGGTSVLLTDPQGALFALFVPRTA
ncbi:VOC family protein [Nocardia sp. CNY236]|uniref:VOC family protein n=1 Tax=Nocardia sp. CNY236 TaxID=1169152 RepID=UPI00040AF62D|nr:VOC family protein [Nocardia sp. CNY236]